MSLSTDRDRGQLETDAQQRTFIRGGRGFLIFIWIALFVFLAIGIVLLVLTCLGRFNDSTGPFRPLWAILFLVLWTLLVLAMIRVVSSQLAGIKRDEEAEPPVAR